MFHSIDLKHFLLVSMLVIVGGFSTAYAGDNNTVNIEQVRDFLGLANNQANIEITGNDNDFHAQQLSFGASLDFTIQGNKNSVLSNQIFSDGKVKSNVSGNENYIEFNQNENYRQQSGVVELTTNVTGNSNSLNIRQDVAGGDDIIHISVKGDHNEVDGTSSYRGTNASVSVDGNDNDILYYQEKAQDIKIDTIGNSNEVNVILFDRYAGNPAPSADIFQRGNGNTAHLVQFGSATISQIGDNNKAIATFDSHTSSANISQWDNNNTVRIDAMGNNNQVSSTQHGNGNSANVRIH